MKRLNENLQEVISIHFNDKTGSKYWVEEKKKLGFNPLKDINEIDDLRLFKFTDPELFRSFPAEYFVPKLYLKMKGKLTLGSSGGRTGKPKWIAYSNETYDYNLKLLGESLDRKNIPENLNFLFVGPTGPHLFGRRVSDICRMRNGLFYTIDFDPRWVRKLNVKDREKYVDHLVEQTLHILESQEIGMLFTTPIMLVRLAREDAAQNIKLRAIGFSGTPMKPDEYRFLAEEIFPNVTFIGYYGNALFGVSVEAQVKNYNIVYQPPEPYALFEIRNPKKPEEKLGYGERGQILGHRITPELFIPNFLETDEANLVKPSEGFEADGIMNPDVLKEKVKELDVGVY